MSDRISNDMGADNPENSSSLHHGPKDSPHIHKVGVPPKPRLLKEITDTLKEMFLPGDPLRPFKKQPRRRKLVLDLQAVFPILEWGRDYNLSKFKGDLIVGLTMASLCISQDIISVMKSVFAAVHHGWNWETVLIGVTFLLFLLFAKYIGKKNKKLFWVPEIAPLLSVIISTFFV